MTSAYGNFTDCGLGEDYAFEVRCVGGSCSEFQSFPSLQCTNSTDSSGTITTYCTNSITCKDSNLTSSSTVTGTGTNFTLRENLTTFGQPFQFTMNPNSSFSFVNESATLTSITSTSITASSTSLATAKSRANRSKGPNSLSIFALFLMLSWLFFPLALTECLPEVSNLPLSLPPNFSSFVGFLVDKTCELGADTILGQAVSVVDPKRWAYVQDIKTLCAEALSEADLPLCCAIDLREICRPASRPVRL
jgi:hypothetical protein